MASRLPLRLPGVKASRGVKPLRTPKKRVPSNLKKATLEKDSAYAPRLGNPKTNAGFFEVLSFQAYLEPRNTHRMEVPLCAPSGGLVVIESLDVIHGHVVNLSATCCGSRAENGQGLFGRSNQMAK